MHTIESSYFQSVVPLQLTCGANLEDYQLAYQTYGCLNQDRSNAILVCPALNASHLVCGDNLNGQGYTGWWSNMVGPGKPIDTQRFFVIGVTNIGGCFGSTGPNSIDSATGKLYGSTFPFVMIQDWVASQEALANALGIDVFAAVIGGSLGGMQVLQWAISYPHRVRHAVVIASAPCLSAQNIAFNEIARQAILNDPDFQSGRYAEDQGCQRNGLRIARMLAHLTYSSSSGLDQKFGRTFRNGTDSTFDFGASFEIESYLRYQGEKFADYFDANSYLLITKALDYFDLARDCGGGDLTQAFACAMSEFLVIAFSEDWRFSPDRSIEIVRALRSSGKKVMYEEVDGSYGHDGFLLDDLKYHQIIRSYFNSILEENTSCKELELSI